MSNFVIITYWWGRGKICKNSSYDYSHGYEKRVKPLLYEQLADKWVKQMKKLKINYYIEERDEFSKTHLYQKGIAYKPKFIQKCLKKFKCPVVYLDMDMRIHKYPYLFENTKFDCMLFNWNIDTRYIDTVYMFTLETSGGLFYFNYTYPAIRMLQLWYKYLNFNKYLGKADDRIFSICFKQNNMLHWTKTYWLPAEYFFIPEYFYGSINPKNVVISHPMRLTPENNAHKLGASDNRIPGDYYKVIKTEKKTMHIHEFFYHHFDNNKQQDHYLHLNNDLIQKNIKHIFKLNSICYNIRNNIFYFNDAISPYQILKLFLQHKCTLKSTLLKQKNVRYYDIIFNHNYDILFFKPSVLSIHLLNDFYNFKNNKNMSYVLGLRYTFNFVK